jgi:CRP/FNR family transcriptional activator FtrB
LDKAGAVDAISMFSKLPPAVKQRLALISGIQNFSKGSLLFREGEKPYFLYGIVSGTIALSGLSDGEETVVDFFGAGELLLVPPALLDLPYMLSARATSDGIAVLIPADKFRELVESDVELASACAKLLARHWRILVAQMKQIKTKDAKTRLVRYILDNAETSGGQTLVTLPGRKKELATHLGVAPETLSRTLRGLKKHGVEVSGSRLSVRSLSRLSKLADFHHPLKKTSKK